MKKMQLLALAMAAALVPGMASADLIAALDFTGGAGAWNIDVKDGGYAYTPELDGDPTRLGYAQNTAASGHVEMYQQVFSPGGLPMENIRVEANVSGYSSWVMLGRLGLALGEGGDIAGLIYNAGISVLPEDLPGGIVYTDEPIVADASGDPLYTGITSVWVGFDVVKGLPGVYVRPDISQIKVYADVIPEPSSLALLALGALAFVRRRFM